MNKWGMWLRCDRVLHLVSLGVLVLLVHSQSLPHNRLQNLTQHPLAVNVHPTLQDMLRHDGVGNDEEGFGTEGEGVDRTVLSVVGGEEEEEGTAGEGLEVAAEDAADEGEEAAFVLLNLGDGDFLANERVERGLGREGLGGVSWRWHRGTWFSQFPVARFPTEITHPQPPPPTLPLRPCPGLELGVRSCFHLALIFSLLSSSSTSCQYLSVSLTFIVSRGLKSCFWIGTATGVRAGLNVQSRPGRLSSPCLEGEVLRQDALRRSFSRNQLNPRCLEGSDHWERMDCSYFNNSVSAFNDSVSAFRVGTQRGWGVGVVASDSAGLFVGLVTASDDPTCERGSWMNG